MWDRRLPAGVAGFAPGRTTAEKKAGVVDVTICVMDVKMAGERIENVLGKLGGQKIKRESLQNMEVISAELQYEKIRDLLDKLGSIGEVKEKGVHSGIPKGNTGIRIVIVSNP